jgi:trans-aconitate 2-methyltransferase
MMAQKKYVWNPTDYAKNSQNQFLWAKELIPKLSLSGNEALLDIGCGDGKITAEIAKCLPNGKAVGIDNSAEMIKLAQNIFPQKDNPNLHFQVMDAKNLAFQNEFDRLFSNAVLHWITDQKTVLLGAQRSLKPNGQLLFQLGGKGNAKDILCILDQLMLEPKWQRFFEGFTFHYAFLDAEEYRALLVEVGLEPLRVELIPKVMKLMGVEGLAGWVRTTWLPYTQRVPTEMRNDFVTEIVTRYLKNHPADNAGTVNLSMVRLEVEAQKQ